MAEEILIKPYNASSIGPGKAPDKTPGAESA